MLDGAYYVAVWCGGVLALLWLLSLPRRGMLATLSSQQRDRLERGDYCEVGEEQGWTDDQLRTAVRHFSDDGAAANRFKAWLWVSLAAAAATIASVLALVKGASPAALILPVITLTVSLFGTLFNIGGLPAALRSNVVASDDGIELLKSSFEASKATDSAFRALNANPTIARHFDTPEGATARAHLSKEVPGYWDDLEFQEWINLWVEPGAESSSLTLNRPRVKAFVDSVRATGRGEVPFRKLLWWFGIKRRSYTAIAELTDALNGLETMSDVTCETPLEDAQLDDAVVFTYDPPAA